MAHRSFARITRFVLAGLVAQSLWAFAPFQAIAEPGLQLVDGTTLYENGRQRWWQMKRSKKMHSATEVQEYLGQLNQGKYADWRLPTKWEMREFFTLFDLKRNGDIVLALDGSYWMMGENGTMMAGSWDSGDQCGVERNFFPAASGYVRAIRP